MTFCARFRYEGFDGDDGGGKAGCVGYGKGRERCTIWGEDKEDTEGDVDGDQTRDGIDTRGSARRGNRQDCGGDSGVALTAQHR